MMIRWHQSARLAQRSTRRRSLATVATLSVAALTLVPTTVGATVPSWHLTKVFVEPEQTMTGVDCTSVKHCVTTTTNGLAVATTNGWLSFTHFAVHGAHFADQMDGVSCASATKCEAVGTWGTATTGYGVVASSVNGGATWSSQHNSPIPHATEAISCVSTSVCVAVGVMGGHTSYWMRTSNGGVNWLDHTGTLSPPVAGLTSVSCETVSFCDAIENRGASAMTTDGGVHWTVSPAFSTVHWLYGVHCVGKQICVAVGQDTKNIGIALYSADGGQHWRQMATPNNVSVLYGVTCVDTTHCFAVGSIGPKGVVLASTSSTSFHTVAIPAGSAVLNGISCLSATWCTAVGGNSLNNAVVMTLH